MGSVRYVTTIRRAILALICGALAGTLAFLLELWILLAIRPNKLEEVNEYLGTADADIYTFVVQYGFIFFAGGLFLVGGPVWALLHRLGLRRWFYAVGLGAVLGSAAYVIYGLWNQQWVGLMLISFLTEEFGGITYSNGGLTNDGWEALYRGVIIIAVAGVVAGLTIWRVAYRRA